MKTVNSKSDLLSLLNEAGQLKEPVTLAQGCELSGLNAVTSLDGLTLAQGCELYDLSDKITLNVDPSDSEMQIIKQIPIERLEMSSWHCGTSHCLAGWAQVISGREINKNTAHSDGIELLPSMSHLFFAPDLPVKNLLLELQSRES